MADNVTTPIAAGTALAADEISGVLYPRTKMSFGPDGSAVDVSSTNPMPINQQASKAPFTITPHNTNALPSIPNGIYVGTGGDVTLRGENGSADVVYKNLPDASFIAVRATHVRATGTTATDLVGEA